jgi:uncharacterized protein (TIGR02996 family)
MSDEDAFLRTILDHPADDAPRLVYADWLDEQGDPVSVRKARFLRTTAQAVRAQPRDRKVLEQRLNGMALGLDADWLAVVSQVPVENCGLFAYRCPKRWEGLATTEDLGVRFCDTCRKPVHYATTVEGARRHAEAARCVAIQLGNQRQPGDLEQGGLMLGLPNVVWSDESEEADDSRRWEIW